MNILIPLVILIVLIFSKAERRRSGEQFEGYVVDKSNEGFLPNFDRVGEGRGVNVDVKSLGWGSFRRLPNCKLKF